MAERLGFGPDRCQARNPALVYGRMTGWGHGSDACVSPVVSLREAPDHPQISARGTLRLAGGRIEPAAAPRFSGSPQPQPAPPARYGAHTSEILSRAGVDVAALLASGAAVQS